jgi:hypothetical protein
VLGALGWVALVLLAAWPLPEVARTVACSKWPGLRIRVLGALKRSGDPEIDRRLAAIAEHETNQAVRQWALDQRVR